MYLLLILFLWRPLIHPGTVLMLTLSPLGSLVLAFCPDGSHLPYLVLVSTLRAPTDTVVPFDCFLLLSGNIVHPLRGCESFERCLLVHLEDAIVSGRLAITHPVLRRPSMEGLWGFLMDL